MKSCVTISLVAEARGGPFVFWDDLIASIRQAEEMGFDAIEIFPPSPDAIDHQQLRGALAASNLQLAALGTGAGWVRHQLTLTSADSAVREQAIAFVRSIINAAAEFGAPAIIGSMQGRATPEVPAQQARDHLRSALDVLGQAASERGVPLLYEPLNRYETNLCNTLADGVVLLESLQTDNVRLLADLFHMNIEERDIAAAFRQAGRHVGHVHFVDSNRRAAGLGHMTYGPIVRSLVDIGYQGYLSAEALPLPSSHEAALQTIRAIHYWTAAARVAGN
ncbi:MAG: sugar phosphate isomerase/epimerase [Planctomycetales bacterium]|nr:sugar phosphate isomerase/epimerase [Planctomycetales bacterium]